MTNVRFLIDENTSPALADQLRRIQPGIMVRKVGDADVPPRGTMDTDILTWLENENFYLITRNRKSMPRHLSDHIAKGGHVPGILTLRPNASMRDIIDDLLLIWEATEGGEYRDQIVHIPL